MYVAIILCWKSSDDSFFTSSTHELSANLDRAERIFPPTFFFSGWKLCNTYVTRSCETMR